MRTSSFIQAVDDALGQAMAADPRIVLFGEDTPLLRRNLLVRFGPNRVRGAPISESAFLGAGVAAAMAGLRLVVELYMVDFVGVCMDALLNHAAKVEAFSGGRWKAPSNWNPRGFQPPCWICAPSRRWTKRPSARRSYGPAVCWRWTRITKASGFRVNCRPWFWRPF